MPIIVLTHTTWLKREADKLEGHLLAWLTKDGLDQSNIVHRLKDMGFVYTAGELLEIRGELVTRGIIEVV